MIQLYSMNGSVVIVHGNGHPMPMEYAALQEELDRATLRAIAYPGLLAFGIRMIQLREAMTYLRSHLTVEQANAKAEAKP